MSCQLVSARRDLVRFLLQTITGNQRGKSWVANLAQWPKRDKNTNARFVCVGEKARQARIAHKVPRIPGGAGGRHVPSGKLITTQRRGKKKKKEEARTYKCVKGTKDEAVDAGPERKGTHTDRIISTSSVKSGQWSFIVTHSHMQRCCWSPHTEKDHPSQFLNSCAIMCSPRPPPPPRTVRVHTESDTHTLKPPILLNHYIF